MSENRPPPRITRRVQRHQQFTEDGAAEPLPERPIWELPWYGKVFFITLPYSLIACIVLFIAAFYGIAICIAESLRFVLS